MGVRHYLVLGIALGATLVACTGLSYKYYALEAESYNGRLLGATAKDDLSFTVCAPNSNTKYNCAVMMQDEFFRFKQDYELTKQQLKECQAKLP